ncbi:glutamine--fructose-6-phosphate transaminase (isomerizing) [Stygiolobus azoricus]|uniref:Glutamine--fructose-6-phosphate aminotransferase [isomerizing] n=1 Tax=Stygiolobus azoricus TaxID=41675 RepID=A0A650CQK3_9CREN|nr:glutamine--fructose-6-phosphate transaminase (isomerizing) [Stygiolobus azoricus]QGR20116.1 glutamine--fructose-6-phosphate transaminase (isomerizing) [Stygiolobus azoricus]
MCGIIGIISSKESKKLSEITISALKRLEYRGYDSVGVASLSSKGIEVRKAKGTVEQVTLKKKIPEMSGYIFLGHTRWATHGAPSDYNAHPHTDCSGRIAVIHNGTIKNFKELRAELESLGHKFNSETDTEVIPHLIEEFIKRGMDSFTAFKSAIKSLDGSYAVLAIIDGEKRIFFAKRDNPLVIGLGEGENYIASDIPAFLPYTKRILVISDGEIGFLTNTSVYIEDLNGNVVDVHKRIRIVDWDVETASKEGYAHFMIKEIHESPKAVRDTISSLMSDLDVVEKISEEIRQAERVIVTGAGTSYHAGLYFSLLLTREGITSIPLIASEYYNVKGKRGDLIIAISQSGETIDVLQSIRKLKSEGAKVVSITNVIESAIARESDYKIYMRAGPEIGVAATKTFTTQVASLLFLYSYAFGKDWKALKDADKEVEQAINATEGFAKRVGEELAKKQNIYYLGRGLSLPLAMEGALKIKEVSYVHAEAYPAGESKHGPISLVESGFPIVFINDGEMPELLKNNVMEMKARGGKIYMISVNRKLGEAELEIFLNSKFPALSISPVIQLIAYYAAVSKGLDPDKPRNLAKTVTVE